MDDMPYIRHCRNPQGGSDLFYPHPCYEGKRLATLTSSPRYVAGTPQGGSNQTITYIQFMDILMNNNLYE